MKNEIKLQNNNKKRDWRDLEWIREFHNFLQGKIPKGMRLSDVCKVKLTPEQSGTIIWYLQQHFPVFPANIEMCDNCKKMYDRDSEGCYYEIEGKDYCGSCEYLSNVVCCDGCMADVWEEDARTDDGEYYCDECKKKHK